MSHKDLDKAKQRVRRYWYEDGLTEIATGCIFVLVGLLFAVEAVFPPESPQRSVSAIGLPVVVIGGSLLARRIVKALKERITYPRTGYVAYRRTSGVRKVVTGAIAGVIGALVAAMLRVWGGSQSFLPMAEGLVIGTGLLFLAHSLGLTRFYVLSVLSALAGTAASLLDLGATPGMAIYFSAVGIALIISGALTLRTYFNKTEKVAKE